MFSVFNYVVWLIVCLTLCLIWFYRTYNTRKADPSITSILCELVGETIISEWVICSLTPTAAISWLEQLNFQWDDDEVRFVLDQHA